MRHVTASERPVFRGFGKLLAAASILSFGLIVLGSLVRATNSGLSCPDWPLCYGQAVPTFDIHIFLEWFHRLVAGTLGIIMITAIVKLLRKPFLRKALGLQIAVAAVLLAIQVVLGGLTVLHLLKPETVNAHLVNAVLFFTTLIWMTVRAKHLGEEPDARRPKAVPQGVKRAFVVTTVLVLVQIAVGGMVSSNYAGLACPDFPTCHGRWLPDLQFPLVLQMVHRGIAFAVLFAVLGLSIWSARASLPKSARISMRLAPSLVVVQIVLGVVNVYYALPIAASVAHLANAVAIYATLLLATIDLYSSARTLGVIRGDRGIRTPVRGDWRIKDQPV